ncbi:hypothetical protein LXT21_06050 [Myxococcus sp. K38C18041901]|uniref:TolB family protein n=1 Tax=Myxococcus guangdongensis TaxID=2906760 RepID=UPI0020A7E0CB|nr:hypothetical protein [Myxococcus guangdongensis]MCP3058325.1 hypothetical protein [Myxococcus guangdongensis]
MASSLALTACGGADVEAASSGDATVAEQSQSAVADRRIIVYLTPSQQLYAVEDGKSTLIAERASTPSVSPDGSQVVFAKLPSSWNVGQPVKSAELHLYKVSNRKTERLTTGHDDQSPSWTPDGKSILFQSKQRSGLASFWRVKPNGKSLAQVTNQRTTLATDPAYVPAPVSNTPVQWGPNQRRIIVYLSPQTTTTTEVRVLKLDAADDVASAYSLGQGTSPTWTQDGTVRFQRVVNGKLVDVEVCVQ